jgi:FG-GAP repeat
MSEKEPALRGLLLALVLAVGVPFGSGFAQAQHKMSPPPTAPKATILPNGNWLPKSVAYIKASNTSKYQQFGSAVALSGDGNTLAVGAPNASCASPKFCPPVISTSDGVAIHRQRVIAPAHAAGSFLFAIDLCTGVGSPRGVKPAGRMSSKSISPFS